MIGGEDQITVIPHLDADLVRARPQALPRDQRQHQPPPLALGNGVASFYGGSTQVHLGPGPGVDDIHARSLRAALVTGETLEVVDPGESEDVGVDWADPRALTSFGEREPTEPWSWHGPARSVTGRTWGGCLEVLEWILTAGRFPVRAVRPRRRSAAHRDVGGAAAGPQRRLDRPRHWANGASSAAVDAVLVARPPVSDLARRPPAEERARLRAEQRDVVVDMVQRYNPEAVVCVGIPFGHTRPQWILPHGGRITVDGTARRVVADYS